jgi:hypothetical protein
VAVRPCGGADEAAGLPEGPAGAGLTAGGGVRAGSGVPVSGVSPTPDGGAEVGGADALAPGGPAVAGADDGTDVAAATRPVAAAVGVTGSGPTVASAAGVASDKEGSSMRLPRIRLPSQEAKTERWSVVIVRARTSPTRQT